MSALFDAEAIAALADKCALLTALLKQADPLAIATRAVPLYAETHPRPPQVTQTQAAEMLGTSRPTLSRMVKAGTLRLNKCGLIPITEIDSVLESGRAEPSCY